LYVSVHVLGIFEHANEPTKCIYIIGEYIHTIFENKMPKFYFFLKITKVLYILRREYT
jgi:hypothetical protein